ncbi:hypothetical protein [Burkholderia ubonensis]|uniref:hypothetical protein n=1 Tax=Burkholderia ubonensis TaxID=101571 RepID=UPI001E39AAAD|nr:hypothetical protein [Burkholderia ubonensis]
MQRHKPDPEGLVPAWSALYVGDHAARRTMTAGRVYVRRAIASRLRGLYKRRHAYRRPSFASAAAFERRSTIDKEIRA